MVRGGKELFLILVILMLILGSFFVYAQDENSTTNTNSSASTLSPSSFNPTTSYNWLYQHVKNSSSMNVDVRALSTIALIQGNPGELSGIVEALKDKEDSNNGCWPSGGCKVKDTALGTLTLALAGQDVSKEVGWLKSARVPGLSGGEWWIVIKGSSNGSCQFSYQGGNKTFNLQDDRIRQSNGGFTNGQYYIGLNELSTSLRNQLQPDVVVGCDPNLLNPIITLIYKPSASTFFIQRSDAGANVDLKLANACFGTQVPAGTCNYESTSYATWALLEVGAITNDQSLSLENIGTHIYLESQALNKKSDPIALGLLNRILIKASSAAPSFISDLVKLQRPVDGSWGGDVIATSIASFSLTGSDQSDSVARGINYLTGRVGADGSWGASIEATSWALIALHGGDLSRIVVGGGNVSTTTPEICGNGIDDNHNGADDCAEQECLTNPICKCVNGIKDPDEQGVDCGTTCPTACTEQEPHVEQQAQEQNNGTTPPPEQIPQEEKKSSLWWLWLLIILVLIGGGILFYVKYIKTGKIELSNLFKKKPKGPTFDEFRRQAEFRPIQQPQRPQTISPTRPMQAMRPTAPANKPKSKDEEELERSIKEAEKLLKG